LRSFDITGSSPVLRQEQSSLSVYGKDLTLSHDGRYLLTYPPDGSAGVAITSTTDLKSIVGTIPRSGDAAAFSAGDSLVYIAGYDYRMGSSDGFGAAIYNSTTFTKVGFFSLGSATGSPGYPINVISIAPIPNGFFFVSSTEGTFNNATGKLRVFGAAPRLTFFMGEVQLAHSFFYLRFPNGNVFGYYAYPAFPVIFHNDLGFEYVVESRDPNGGVYLYDFASATWWYTSPSLFPYLYDFSLGAFLYYFPDPNDPNRYNTNGVRYFFNFNTNQIITK
jgi:hypothetical protein